MEDRSGYRDDLQNIPDGHQEQTLRSGAILARAFVTNSTEGVSEPAVLKTEIQRLGRRQALPAISHGHTWARKTEGYGGLHQGKVLPT
jgi:hypothetical protein